MGEIVGGVRVRVRAGTRAFGVRRTNEARQGCGGEGSRRHYAKEMVSSVIPGIPMATEVVAFRTSYGIVSARLSANNGRARASRASKSDGCLALLKRTSYIKHGRCPDPRYNQRRWVGLMRVQFGSGCFKSG